MTSLSSALAVDKIQHVANLFRTPGSLPELYIYVEDDQDKPFWRTCLSKYSNRYKINTCIYNSGGKGKDGILRAVQSGNLKLSSTALLGIDSDYDYWVEDKTYYHLIHDNRYIICTGGWYSMENLKCTPDNVSSIIYQLSLEDYIDINVNDIYINVSFLFSEFFLLSVVLSLPGLKDYTLSDFEEDFSHLSFNCKGEIEESTVTYLEKRKQEIEKESALFSIYAECISDYKDKFQKAGFSTGDYYKLMKGHAIKNELSAKLIFCVVVEYIYARLNLIRNLEKSSEEKQHQLSELKNLLGIKFEGYEFGKPVLKERICTMLDDCLNIKETDAYKKIEDQLTAILDS